MQSASEGAASASEAHPRSVLPSCSPSSDDSSRRFSGRASFTLQLVGAFLESVEKLLRRNRRTAGGILGTPTGGFLPTSHEGEASFQPAARGKHPFSPGLTPRPAEQSCHQTTPNRANSRQFPPVLLPVALAPGRLITSRPQNLRPDLRCAHALAGRPGCCPVPRPSRARSRLVGDR
jgi:hypothetical protein